MSLIILPLEIVISIISQLNRHEMLLINRVSHYFNNLCNSNEYKNILISLIKGDMNLEFNKYSLDQLKTLFLMTKRKNLHENFIFGKDGTHYINSMSNMINLIPNSQNIIQFDSYFLDNKGHIYNLEILNDDSPVIKKIERINNIKKLLGEKQLLDYDGNYSYYNYDNDEFKLFDNPNKIVKYDVYNLSDKGHLWCYKGKREITKYCFIKMDQLLFLDDMGDVFIFLGINENDIRLIPNTERNVIDIAYCNYGICLILNKKGKISYFYSRKVEEYGGIGDVNIISLDLNNITDISYYGYMKFIAMDYYKTIYIINFEKEEERIRLGKIETLYF